MKENNLLNSSIDEIKINKIIQDNFSTTWLWFYQLQLPIILSWKKKLFNDFHSYYIWGTCSLNQMYNNKDIADSSMASFMLDDFIRYTMDNAGLGLNAMSISEMTKIPRATVIRKLKKLKKENMIKSNSLKQYYVSDLTPLKVAPIIQEHFKAKAEFIAKMINLLVVKNSA